MLQAEKPLPKPLESTTAAMTSWAPWLKISRKCQKMVKKGKNCDRNAGRKKRGEKTDWGRERMEEMQKGDE